MNKTHWSTPYYEMIEQCENKKSQLTLQEKFFVSDIKKRLQANIFPTRRQIDMLNIICNKLN